MKFLMIVAASSALAVAAAQADPKPGQANEPMTTKMMKPGMKTGDVRKAAEKREEEMKPMLEKESAAEGKK